MATTEDSTTDPATQGARSSSALGPDGSPGFSSRSEANATAPTPNPQPHQRADTSGAPGLAFETWAEQPTSLRNAGAPSVTASSSRVGSPPRSLQDTPHLTPTCSLKTINDQPPTSNDPILPEAQRRWSARPITERLQPIRLARHWMAAHPEAFTHAISADLARSPADTLTAELLPLLDAMRFLERRAHKLLAPRRLGTSGRPLWLTGVAAEVHRDPLGHVLVIGPANFPLFLPGTHVLQALVAGNAVTWKPGLGGQKVALLVAHALREAGLPRGILRITDESVAAAEQALAEHPDKVVFTGSFDTGSKILRTLAETATPATMELSGADAVIVLPSADLPLVARAVAFGLRLNGGEVCMSPRRLIATPDTLAALRPLLETELAKVPAVPLKPRTATLLQTLLNDALSQGATLLSPAPTSEPSSRAATAPPSNNRALSTDHRALSTDHRAPTTDHRPPVLLDHATPQMAITRTDLFAPVLSLIKAPSVLHLSEITNNNPFGLTAAIFGNPREARALAAQLRVGTVVINDLIAPTADPRVPFAGRARSGFGATRGAEGLLEMTAPRTLLVRPRGTPLHYDPVGWQEVPLLASLIGVLHGATLSGRLRSLRNLIAEGRKRGSAPGRTKRA